jgi:hypothetical protein
MSQAEVKRFIADLKSKPALMKGLKGKATGIASVVAYATAAGYAITAADARDYVRSLSLKNLSDAHLDHLAGGKGGGSSTATAAVQTALAVTTAVQTAEAVTTVAAAADAAAAVEVVAVAAVVLT